MSSRRARQGWGRSPALAHPSGRSCAGSGSGGRASLRLNPSWGCPHLSPPPRIGQVDPGAHGLESGRGGPAIPDSFVRPCVASLGRSASPWATPESTAVATQGLNSPSLPRGPNRAGIPRDAPASTLPFPVRRHYRLERLSDEKQKNTWRIGLRSAIASVKVLLTNHVAQRCGRSVPLPRLARPTSNPDPVPGWVGWEMLLFVRLGPAGFIHISFANEWIPPYPRARSAISRRGFRFCQGWSRARRATEESR
jgi:hypothetical protein